MLSSPYIMRKKIQSPARAPKRSDDGAAFLPDPYAAEGHTPMRSRDELAETLAEEFVASVTSGEPVAEAVRDAITPEELGGPFVATTAEREFAQGVDATNPEGATAEAFPTANRGQSG